jgi:hypothetical protein
MTSLGPAKHNSLEALENSREVSAFINSGVPIATERPGMPADPTAQALFNVAIGLFSDSLNEGTIRQLAGSNAENLAPWIVLPNTKHPNYGRFCATHTLLDELAAGDDSAYSSSASRNKTEVF